jgi:peptidoglycan/LPS O-acetylase OafA/YrhL
MRRRSNCPEKRSDRGSPHDRTEAMTPNPHARPVDREYLLDLTRFFAAFIVMLYHYGFRGGIHGDYLPQGSVLYPGVTKYFFVGVEMFFVLSGYIIYRTASDSTIPDFIASRVSRIVPLLWICALVTFVVVKLLPVPGFSVDAVDLVASMFLVAETIGVTFVDGVYWTLLHEVQFYALFTLVLLVRDRALRRFCWWAWVLAGALLLDPESFWFQTLYPGGAYSMYFSMGLAIALTREHRAHGWGLFLVSAALVLARLAGTVQAQAARFATDMLVWPEWLLVFGVAAVLWLSVSGVARWREDGRGSRWVPAILVLGTLTYPLYLLHQMVGYALLLRLRRVMDYPSSMVLAGATIVTISYVLAIHVDPVLRARCRRWVRRLFPPVRLREGV